jgi:HAD superfamily hydrolase (TIGR01509 family)
VTFWTSDAETRAPRVLLCDADGTLFPSEVPAYEVSAEVTNSFLAELGIPERYTAEELRLAHTGKNFRVTAEELCRRANVRLPPQELEAWVEKEKDAVTARLRRTLQPHHEVTEALSLLRLHFDLAVVTSSASTRVDACLASTGLEAFFAPLARFSAEDSLRRPISKPHPAVYELAGARMSVGRGEALALEDSEAGVRAAVTAGYETIGLVHFVPAEERASRAAALVAAGASGVMESWSHLASRLLRRIERTSSAGTFCDRGEWRASACCGGVSSGPLHCGHGLFERPELPRRRSTHNVQ